MKVKCWKCGGKGWLFDHEEGLFTFGIGYIIQALAGMDSKNIHGEYINKRCPICNGKGYQETKEYHDWNEEQRADGIQEENIDCNEISFDLE